MNVKYSSPNDSIYTAKRETTKNGTMANGPGDNKPTDRPSNKNIPETKADQFTFFPTI